MNQYVDAFLKGVLGEVKYKKIHPYLAQELNDHIELLKEDLMMEEGLDEETAYKQAVAQMGNAKEVGEGFHKTHKPVLEWRVLALMGILIGIGFLAILGYDMQFETDGRLVMKQMFMAASAGFAVIYILYEIKYSCLEKLTWVFYIVPCILLVSTMFIGIEVNGIRRWVNIGPLVIQPATVAVPLFIIAFVNFIRKWGNQGFWGWFKVGLLAELSMILCMFGYFSKAVVLGISYIVIMVIYTYTKEFKGSRKKVIGILLTAGILGSILTVIYNMKYAPDRWARILTYLNPEQDPTGSGYVTLAVRQAVQKAHWMGSSINPSDLNGPFSYEGNSDLIFTFIIGHMGMLAAAGIVLLVVLMIGRCFNMGHKVRDSYGKMIIYGFSTYFALQFIMSIAFSMGWVSVGMSYMPFISYGGSNLVIDMMMMGLILSIYRYKDIVPYELLNKKIEAKVTTEKKVSLFKDMFMVIADEEELDEELEEVIAEKPSSLLVKLAMVILRHSSEVEKMDVKFKGR